ncbi:Phenolic glucoside malonyltransferase 2 [Forsythia ovata]|uniref:Phenolic glucoside malonyltransferase 2 n=1 Tax=Forsythia ovata TaxID=205694 RepID=A0ABD1RZM6_9LAMI
MHQKLIEKDRFFDAAEAISEIIRIKVNNKDEILKDVETWLMDVKELMGKQVLLVSGSPKFDLYNADCGWGRPKKLEAVSIDGDNAISLCKSREFKGGLEFGLPLSTTKMDAFAAIFANGTRDLFD